MTRIAVIGMACRYPDAASPTELWENALAGRRAFRRLPDERMRLEDYWDPDPRTPDRFYARQAAVIEGYEFDRIAYKVAGSTYRSTDLTHWLALDVAAAALADAGFPMGEGLPRQATGVIVGNTLTGEFSRANQLRLRWPYVRRVVAAALKEQDWDDARLGAFLEQLESTFKSPFPEVDEDTLAGALANTIAGRICNHLDLRGGGYTVDGACSSSLLSVATACKALVDGELNVAVAGGVDLSIDPFEIIGFAKTGALASSEMRVYDQRSNGFLPGEGCGMAVLMRESEARAAGHRIYATIAGWGISSDGRGGITRPEATGYRLALRRAYERAGFGIETVGLFEGHGTGTKVGDTTELTALAEERAAADPHASPAAISAIKAMIGHTKAAAGIAGLIKAAMATHHEVLPPTLGCVEPHDVFGAQSAPLRMLRKAEPWPSDSPVRAGVTAMGFGGINTHLVLENDRPRRRARFDRRTHALASSMQDVELLLVDALSPQELRDRLQRLTDFVPSLAYAELADLAATLHGDLRELPWRAAIVVSSPDDAVQRLNQLCASLDSGETELISPDGRTMLGHASGPGKIGFLFPGQGSGRGTNGGALRRRFAEAEQAYAQATLPSSGDMVATEVAQPRIVTGSLAGLHVLSALGIEASVGLGHSLGEISALYWAGAFDSATLLRVAGVRGRTMAAHSSSGTMAGVSASPEVAERIIGDRPVVIAGYNGPTQTVVAGPVEEIEAVVRDAAEAGVSASRLNVSHAFHSPLVEPAADAFGELLTVERFNSVDRRVISTVTGEGLADQTDLKSLLRRQITDPVLFSQAIALAAKEVDLFVEVGPGRVLSGLATAATDVPAIALDTDNESLAGLLSAVSAAYVIGGQPVDSALFHGRLTRPLSVGTTFSFFANPCEAAPTLPVPATTATTRPAEPTNDPIGAPTAGESTVDTMRRLAAERAELPLELVNPDSRLLDDLHLSSITVGQVVNHAAQALGVPVAQAPTNFAVATVQELADALDSLVGTGETDAAPIAAQVTGAAEWIRAWRVDLDDVPLSPRAGTETGGAWQVFAAPDSTFAEPLRRALERAGVGGGVLLCLPSSCTTDELESALTAARAALAGGDRFVLVQSGRGAAGLAKTLHLEDPRVRTTVVHLPEQTPTAIDTVVAEVAATTAFSETYHDPDGTRRVPTLRAMPVRATREQPALDQTDVLLVTGGGKGITAECALAMAQDSGARLVLLGRSDPTTDRALADNLDRIANSGIRVRYLRADVTDAEQLVGALNSLPPEWGPITAVLHGAGRNEPTSLNSLTMADLDATFAPKVDGLRNVLAAVDPAQLRLLVSLGSIIGRAGLRGEAHYAIANEWLADATAEVGRQYPGCRALCLEWSVWSGVGMGERLSVVESLARDGITPITPDQGVALLRRLLADPDTPPVVVISGRTEGIHTVRHDAPPLPLLRFVERPLVRYHGVELVSEVELSSGTDRYLEDHLLDGNLLFPAVFGMEAMAQVSAAVTGESGVPVIEDAEFLRPIIVPPAGSTTVRVAVVVTDDRTVDAVIQSAETGFGAEHFRARLRYGGTDAPDGPPNQVAEGLPVVPLDPVQDLYGHTLFQGQRFQRLHRYHRSAARNVDAEVVVPQRTDWFAPYLSAELLLGDPGVRDALMHGNQVCVPEGTLLPAGIERVWPGGGRIEAEEVLRYAAVERSRDGDTYVYDIALRTTTGRVVERWSGLRLRAVRKRDGRGPWVAPLLGSYLERTLGDLGASGVAVALEPDESASGTTGDHVATRRGRTALAAGRALGRPVEVRYRPDGRPEVAGEGGISAAHGAGMTLCVAGTGPLGCDVEPVAERSPADWKGLLGRYQDVADLIATRDRETAHTAGTRIWAATESLRKAGYSTGAPLVLLPDDRGPWVTFTSGDVRIATLLTTVRDGSDPVVLAALFAPTRRKADSHG